MRSREFLKEYDQAITAQRFGPAMLARSARDVDAGMGPKIVADMSDAKRMELITNLLNHIEQADPTPNKQYVPWLAKMYAEGGPQSRIEDLQSTVKDALTKFHELKTRRQIPSPRNDIMRYSNAGDFLSVMDEYPDPSELSPTQDRGQAKEIIRTDQLRVIVPHDQAAACYYGRGTRWCTAAQNNNMFDAYSQDGFLYIFLPQQPEYPGEKYQMHIEAGQAMNEKDQPVDPQWLVAKRFGDLLPAFRPYVRGIQNLVMFADPDVLQAIMEQMEHRALRQAQAMRKSFESQEAFDDWITMDVGHNFWANWTRLWLFEDWIPSEGDPPFLDDLPLAMSTILNLYGGRKSALLARWIEEHMSVGKMGGVWRVMEV